MKMKRERMILWRFKGKKWWLNFDIKKIDFQRNGKEKRKEGSRENGNFKCNSFQSICSSRQCQKEIFFFCFLCVFIFSVFMFLSNNSWEIFTTAANLTMILLIISCWCSLARVFVCLTIGFSDTFQLVLLLNGVRVWWSLRENE